MKIDKLIAAFQVIRAKYPQPEITNQDILKMMELKIRLENRARRK